MHVCRAATVVGRGDQGTILHRLRQRQQRHLAITPQISVTVPPWNILFSKRIYDLNCDKPPSSAVKTFGSRQSLRWPTAIDHSRRRSSLGEVLLAATRRRCCSNHEHFVCLNSDFWPPPYMLVLVRLDTSNPSDMFWDIAHDFGL